MLENIINLVQIHFDILIGLVVISIHLIGWQRITLTGRRSIVNGQTMIYFRMKRPWFNINFSQFHFVCYWLTRVTNRLKVCSRENVWRRDTKFRFWVSLILIGWIHFQVWCRMVTRNIIVYWPLKILVLKALPLSCWIKTKFVSHWKTLKWLVRAIQITFRTNIIWSIKCFVTTNFIWWHCCIHWWHWCAWWCHTRLDWKWWLNIGIRGFWRQRILSYSSEILKMISVNSISVICG